MLEIIYFVEKAFLPTFKCNEFENIIEVAEGCISWSMFHEFYEKDILQELIWRKHRNLHTQLLIQETTNKTSYLLSLSLMKPPQQLLRVVTQTDLMRQIFYLYFIKYLSYEILKMSLIPRINLEMQLYLMISNQNFFHM